MNSGEINGIRCFAGGLMAALESISFFGAAVLAFIPISMYNWYERPDKFKVFFLLVLSGPYNGIISDSAPGCQVTGSFCQRGRNWVQRYEGRK